MSCALSTIERHCGKTFGGLKSIKLFLDSAVDSMPVQYCSPNLSGDITLDSGESFHEIKFDRFTAQFTERKLITQRAGDYYEQTLTFDITHDRAEVATFINNLDNRRIHAVIVDRNDKQRLLKNLRQRNSTDSGDVLSSFNGNKFVFVGRSRRRSPFIKLEEVEVGSCDITLSGEYSGPSAASALSDGEYYYLSGSNVFGYPSGIVFIKGPSTTYVSDAAAESGGITLGTCYAAAQNNIYSIAYSAIVRRINESVTTYDSDAIAAAAGVSIGDIYTLSPSNVYHIGPPMGGLQKRRMS